MAANDDPSGSGGWRFAQCFGDKGEVEDITEGSQGSILPPPILLSSTRGWLSSHLMQIADTRRSSRHHFHC